MQESTEIYNNGSKIYFSDKMIPKIKYLIKKAELRDTKRFDSLEVNGINYSDLESIIDSVAYKINIFTNNVLNEVETRDYDKDLENQLRNLYDDYLKITPSKDSKYLLSIFINREDLEGLERLINLITQIKVVEEKMLLLSDLTNAKDDLLIDMKYFMNEEDINRFESQYSQAIREKNINKMKQMLNQVQQLVLKEWENYFDNIDSMNSENFCFLGHSTNSTRFEKPFQSRYVSCSLLNQNINDTYRSARCGFIMSPTKIVAADSRDMYINNYAADEDGLIKYSSIPIIHHPQRIIDECMKYIQKNKEKNEQKSVYNEIVVDGFNPVGIFCFTNGAKNLDWIYRGAMALHKYFPDLKVKTIDFMKIKKGTELANMQLELINVLRREDSLSGFEYRIEDLPRFEWFFQKFDLLKKTDNYSEEDIKKLYKYNLELLHLFTADELFDGKYKDEEIKFALGKSRRYDVDNILAGNITFYSLDGLRSLVKYKDKLNHYYDGLSEFVELLNIVEIDDNLIEEMKKELPLNFYKLTKILESNCNKKSEMQYQDLNTELEMYKTKYQCLKEEQKNKKEIEEKYKLYFDIYNNRYYIDLLQRDFDDLENKKAKDELELKKLIKQNQLIDKSINNLISANNVEFSKKYQESSEYNQIKSRISFLNEHRNTLKLHSFVNSRKINIINDDINELENKLRNNIAMFEITKTRNIAKRESLIKELKSNVENVKYKLSCNKDERDRNRQELDNLNKKVFEYYKCSSLKEAKAKIQEAEDFINNYDYFNRTALFDIEEELHNVEKQIINLETKIESIPIARNR